MKVIATVSDMQRVAIVLDLESGSQDFIPVRAEFIDLSVRGRAPCRPFGITWTSDKLFIANNRQILVFDKQLNYVHTLTEALQINTHQLAYRDGLIWAVSPWANSVIGVSVDSGLPSWELDLLTREARDYRSREGSEAADQYHFNSLLWTETQLFVAAHALGKESLIYLFDAASLRFQRVLDDVGTSIHGIAFDKGELFWIDTGAGEIRSSLGLHQQLFKPGYARGLAVTRHYFIVAISDHLTRLERHTRGSWIQVIDRNRQSLLAEWRLQDTGSVNDLRLLDEYDFAHGLTPFLDQEKRRG
jgi:hypothetical protein